MESKQRRGEAEVGQGRGAAAEDLPGINNGAWLCLEVCPSEPRSGRTLKAIC